MTHAINLPDVLAEVSNAFACYEDALVNNKVDVLDSLFWNSSHTVRYGATENLYGYSAIQAFRAARSGQGLSRLVVRSHISTYGRNYATTHIEFTRAERSVLGRQSQTWLRFPEGWRIVSAHVSQIAHS